MTGPTSQGRRIYPEHGKPFLCAFEPGDYGQSLGGIWYGRPPTGCPSAGCFERHEVTEHEDGTITVSPSIECRYGRRGVAPAPGYEGWHGWLERGIWRGA